MFSESPNIMVSASIKNLKLIITGIGDCTGFLEITRKCKRDSSFDFEQFV